MERILPANIGLRPGSKALRFVPKLQHPFWRSVIYRGIFLPTRPFVCLLCQSDNWREMFFVSNCESCPIARHASRPSLRWLKKDTNHIMHFKSYKQLLKATTKTDFFVSEKNGILFAFGRLHVGECPHLLPCESQQCLQAASNATIPIRKGKTC